MKTPTSAKHALELILTACDERIAYTKDPLDTTVLPKSEREVLEDIRWIVRNAPPEMSQEEIEQLRERPTQARLDKLARHYRNERLHNTRLRVALTKIIRDTSTDKHMADGLGLARLIAEHALTAPQPPNPLANLYKDGPHTGHPFPEYLELPFKQTDEYLTDTE
jgi:hypothetical protein